MMGYNSNLQIDYSNTYSSQISFKLSKSIYCKTSKIKDLMVDKLERLKEENFNRVLIPDFKYEVCNDTVNYNVDFIKGSAVGTLVPKYASIVYEDVVKRKSDWTFFDLSTINFIVEFNTENIYAVDFQSYAYIPNHDHRESQWHSSIKSDSEKINSLLNIKI